MNYFNAIQAFVNEVRALSGYRVVRDELVRAEAPLDEAVEAELRDECERFELDAGMRSWWSEIANVRVEWEGPPNPDGSTGGGVLWVPSVFDMARPAYVDNELDAMVPSTSAERALLLELHLLALHDATHWSALRIREGYAPEVWYRTTDATGRTPLDVPIGPMERYTEMMMRARGADRWQCLLVDPNRLSDADARALALREAPVLIRALEALASVPSARADALVLVERARALRDRAH